MYHTSRQGAITFPAPNMAIFGDLCVAYSTYKLQPTKMIDTELRVWKHQQKRRREISVMISHIPDQICGGSGSAQSNVTLFESYKQAINLMTLHCDNGRFCSPRKTALNMYSQESSHSYSILCLNIYLIHELMDSFSGCWLRKFTLVLWK